MSTAAARFTRSRSGITPRRVIIRALWPCEHEHFLRHLLRLDGPARSERFGRGVSDDWIARYAAETDWLRGAVLGCWMTGRCVAPPSCAAMRRARREPGRRRSRSSRPFKITAWARFSRAASLSSHATEVSERSACSLPPATGACEALPGSSARAWRPPALR
jgi:hypothetical protein